LVLEKQAEIILVEKEKVGVLKAVGKRVLTVR
jgi:hypothetical protein